VLNGAPKEGAIADVAGAPLVNPPKATVVEAARFADNLSRFLQDRPDKVYTTADQAALEAFMATMASQ
jgi:hypothetical protein